MRIEVFIADDSGAVAVDWVVLISGVVGLGMASMSVISGGVEDLAGETQASLVSTDISNGFLDFQEIQLALLDFASGAGGWQGGTVTDVPGMGEMLVVGADEFASMSFEVPIGADQAVMEFTLIGGDSLDSETATFTLNGQTIMLATGNHGAIGFTDSGVEGVSIETIIHAQNASLGGAPQWQESISTVRITVTDPAETLTLGVHSNANQATDDEYFGVDNFEITAS